MAEFRCTYENHQGEAILGFCVNISCFQTPQFCLKCLMNKQQNHSSQCLGFESIKECLSEYIQKENQFYGQIKEIENTSKTLFNQLLMNAQNNLKKLQHLKELLQNREYIKFKNEINLFRKYHSKVEEAEKSKLLSKMQYNKTDNINQFNCLGSQKLYIGFYQNRRLIQCFKRCQLLIIYWQSKKQI